MMSYSQCFEGYSATYILGAAISSGLAEISVQTRCVVCVLCGERRRVELPDSQEGLK